MTRWAALAAFALLLAAGCAEDPLGSGSFPCAQDGTCPEPYTCTVGTTDDSIGICSEGCSSSFECEEGSRCGEAGDTDVCMAECTPFGTDCEGATTCRVQPLAGEAGFFATCVALTAGRELLAPCDTAIDCPPLATCYRAGASEQFTCHPQCDPEHPCRHGKSCRALLPSGAGVCR